MGGFFLVGFIRSSILFWKEDISDADDDGGESMVTDAIEDVDWVLKFVVGLENIVLDADWVELLIVVGCVMQKDSADGSVDIIDSIDVAKMTK